MAEPSRLALALEYLGGLDAAVAPKLRAVSDAIDPVNVARRAGLNLPTGAQATEAAHFVGPGADIEGMVNDAREGNAAFGRGDLLGALGGYGSAAMAIPMMALPGTVAGVKKGVGGVVDALPMGEADRMKRALDQSFDIKNKWFRGVSGDHTLRENSMWTKDPQEAAHYASGAALTNDGTSPNIIPAFMKEGRGRDIDDEIMDAIMDGENPDLVAKSILKKEGLDWVEFSHPSVSSNEDHLVRVVADPSSARSPFAAFDPSKIDSANLLASALTAGVFGAGVAGSTNKEPE